MENLKLKTDVKNPESDFSSNKILIAPCGMNCGICRAFLREKNRCNGCRIHNKSRLNHCFTCAISNCDHLEKTDSGFCFDCEKYPCEKLKNMDQRYRTKYGTSTIENLNFIKKHGLDLFVKNELVRWTCKECGSIISVHHGHCLNCKN